MNRPILSLKKLSVSSETTNCKVVPETTPMAVIKMTEVKKVGESEVVATQKAPVRVNKSTIPPVLSLLCQEFPKTFDIEMRKPLKVGIHKDILAAFRDNPEVNEESLSRALKYYTRGLKYQRNLVNDIHRVDLKGDNVGTITELNKTTALEFVKYCLKRIKKARETRELQNVIAVSIPIVESQTVPNHESMDTCKH